MARVKKVQILHKRKNFSTRSASPHNYSGLIILLLFLLVVMSAFNIVLYFDLLTASDSAAPQIKTNSLSGAVGAESTEKNTAEASIVILPRPQPAQENTAIEK